MVYMTDIKQRTPEWYAAKKGLASPSGFAPILVKGRAKGVDFGEVALKHAAKLALQRMALDDEDEGYTSDAMERGIMMEPRGISAYEDEMMVTVQGDLFMVHKELPVCYSPDGLVSDKDGDGGMELKCPGLGAHAQTLLSNEIPSKYMPQMNGYLWATGRAFWDYVSYHPGMPDRKKLVIIRHYRDEKQVKELADRVEKFLELVSKNATEFGVVNWSHLDAIQGHWNEVDHG